MKRAAFVREQLATKSPEHTDTHIVFRASGAETVSIVSEYLNA